MPFPSKLSSAVEQTADSILITDRHGIIQYVNPAFEKLTGYSKDEAVGRKPNILKSGLADPTVYVDMWNTILSGRPYRRVLLNQKKNGEQYYEDKTITPIHNAEGQITHFVSAGRDKTEQKKTEELEKSLQEALRNAAAEWKATFDAVDTAILVTDSSGRIIRLNHAAKDLISGEYAAIVGKCLSHYAAVEPWKQALELSKSATQSRQPASAQVQAEDSDKSWYVTANISNHPELKHEGLIITVRDITRIIELQESLRRSETMSAMGSLVAGVAHEVRNPLFSIMATLDAFDARFGSREEQQEHIRVLRQGIDRLNVLMKELLEYGKPAPVSQMETAIEWVITEAVRGCAFVSDHHQVAVDIDLAPNLPKVCIDPQRVILLFQNLIQNAIQHSSAGGKVSVHVERTALDDGSWLSCRVRDHGAGLRADDLSRIFEPFFTRRRGGTGLGLAIVQKIVEEHHGKVIAGNHPDGGAEIMVRFRAVDSRS